MNSDEYLGAFMSGLEFALLAFEGRLRDAGLDGESEERVAAFVRDYHRILEQYRAKAPVPPVPHLVALAVTPPSPRHN